jgi:DNA-binding CsgD family transcriptional regulator
MIVQGRSATDLEELSNREMHIFQLLGSGLSTTQIAQSLGLSVKTIETHREKHQAEAAFALRRAGARARRQMGGTKPQRVEALSHDRLRELMKCSRWANPTRDTCSHRPVGCLRNVKTNAKRGTGQLSWLQLKCCSARRPQRISRDS